MIIQLTVDLQEKPLNALYIGQLIRIRQILKSKSRSIEDILKKKGGIRETKTE